jgi:hypothetical protein
MTQVTFTPEELKCQSHHAGTYDVTREWDDVWQGVPVHNCRAIRVGLSSPQKDHYKLFTRYPDGHIGVRLIS